jgi:predicted RNase H-like HicB family nuclease
MTENAGMENSRTRLEFTGAIFKEKQDFVSLCLEVDVASQGRTKREAKKMLGEAVALYIESCMENNAPYLRPVPPEEDPRFHPVENFVEIFPLKIGIQVHAVV